LLWNYFFGAYFQVMKHVDMVFINKTTNVFI
jgi:hypothetical protein